ncbi:HAD family hydrolase [Streptomyces sp. NPDC001508]|uniref:HAD family hydrolase n=1 Tax=Streptomyces sp. NPDC001508 TaxID=3154656 RepID=UPI00331B59FE
MSDVRLPCRLAALDMNGTTIADNGAFETALHAGLARVGTRFPDEDTLSRLRGIAKADLFRRLVPDADLRATAYETFIESFLDTIAGGGVTAVPGAGEALGELSALGVSVCLMTGFPHEIQSAILDVLGWRSLVDASVSSDGVPHGRPAPDMVLRAAELTDCPDLRTVAVVGDTVSDLTAGHRAGAGLVIGVLTGAHTAERLAAAQPTHVIASVAELPALVTGLTSAGERR